MSSEVLEKRPAAYLDLIKSVFLQPRALFEGISGGREEWRRSLILALAAIMVNSIVSLAVKGGVGNSLQLAVYLAVLIAVYTLILHFLGRWLLQAEGVSLTTSSTAMNYAMLLAAFVSIPMVGVAALIYFLYLIFLAAQALYRATAGRAVVTVALLLLAALVFETFLSLFGLFD